MPSGRYCSAAWLQACARSCLPSFRPLTNLDYRDWDSAGKKASFWHSVRRCSHSDNPSEVYGHWFSFGAISGLADIAPQMSNLSCKPKHEPLNFFNEVQVVVDGSESICPAPEPSVRKAWSQSSDLHKSLMCAAEKCDSYRAQHTWVCSSGSPHQDLRCRSLARRRQLHRLVSPLAMLRCFALCSFDLRRSPQH